MKHVACGPAFSIAINEFGINKVFKYIDWLLIPKSNKYLAIILIFHVYY